MKLAAATLLLLLSATTTLPTQAATIEPNPPIVGYYSDQYYATPDINNFAQAAQTRPTITGIFQNTNENDGHNLWSNTDHLLEQAWQGQTTPFVNLIVENATAKQIADGQYDNEINDWIHNHLTRYLNRGENRNLILAPLQEGNGNWTTYGCDPDNYKKAYQHIINLTREAGYNETQIRYAWAPNGWTPSECGNLQDYYPGHNYTDILAFSAYNWGTCFTNTNWQTPQQTLETTIQQLHQIKTSAPIILAQTASPTQNCGGTQNQWIEQLYNYTNQNPQLTGFIWFNLDTTKKGETDWRIWNANTNKLTDTWKQNSQLAPHQWPLTTWFQPGPLHVNGTNPQQPICNKNATHACDQLIQINTQGNWQPQTIATTTQPKTYYYGNPQDKPFTGDWNCNGEKTPGLYRQTDGYVYLRNTNTQGNADIKYYFGNPQDIPLPGDFNGDGCDTLSLYRPNEQRFYIINKLGTQNQGLGPADYSFTYGNKNDQPLAGDWNGNGIDTIGLYRTTDSYIYLRNTNTQGNADNSYHYGNPQDQIFTGDWNGNGIDTIALYRTNNQTIYIKNENNSKNAPYKIPTQTQGTITSSTQHNTQP